MLQTFLRNADFLFDGVLFEIFFDTFKISPSLYNTVYIYLSFELWIGIFEKSPIEKTNKLSSAAGQFWFENHVAMKNNKNNLHYNLKKYSSNKPMVIIVSDEVFNGRTFSGQNCINRT